MKNKKGFTLVEVIVSVVLVSIILVSMLTTLVKLKELYAEVHENSDALIYGSSVARMINNDLMKNNGIRYIVCDTNGKVCNITLGNDRKRKLEIVTKVTSERNVDARNSGLEIESSNILTTLKYTDTTESEEKIVYIRTLESNVYTTYDKTSGELQYVTSDGYNFQRIIPDEYTQDIGGDKKDVVTSLKINIYDGIDETNTDYSAIIYAAGRYDGSGKKGERLRLELNTNVDDGSLTDRGSFAIDEIYAVGFYEEYTTNQIRTISVPKREGYMFSGYYYYKGLENPPMIIDASGNIIVKNNYFEESVLLDSASSIKAKWEQCVGGYEYDRNSGECKQREYTVNFDKNTGTGGSDSVTAKYKALVPTISIPTRPGYKFEGYYLSAKKYYNSDGSGSAVWEEANWDSSTQKLVAQWTPRTDTPYKVVHWKQKINGGSAHNSDNYDIEETENKQGTTDTTVSPSVKTYTGFTSPTVQAVTIAGTGTAEVNYYYDRNSYTITVNTGSGINSVSGAGTYKYGKNLTIDANVAAGYTWSGWTNGSGNLVSNNKSYSFNVSNNATFNSNATANTNTPYTVRHWKQKVGGGTEHNTTNYDLDSTQNLTGTTGTSVTPSPNTYTGFTTPPGQSITISGNGNSVVNYYYDRNTRDVYVIGYPNSNVTIDGVSYSLDSNGKSGLLALTYGTHTFVDGHVSNTKTVNITENTTVYIGYFYYLRHYPEGAWIDGFNSKNICGGDFNPPYGWAKSSSTSTSAASLTLTNTSTHTLPSGFSYSKIELVGDYRSYQNIYANNSSVTKTSPAVNAQVDISVYQNSTQKGSTITKNSNLENEEGTFNYSNVGASSDTYWDSDYCFNDSTASFRKGPSQSINSTIDLSNTSGATIDITTVQTINQLQCSGTCYSPINNYRASGRTILRVYVY